MLWFLVSPIFVEIFMVLIIFLTAFDWRFFLLQAISIFIYIYSTYKLTEWRAGKFKGMMKAD